MCISDSLLGDAITAGSGTRLLALTRKMTLDISPLNPPLGCAPSWHWDVLLFYSGVEGVPGDSQGQGISGRSSKLTRSLQEGP